MSYDLGTAHGKIVLDYDGKRDVDKAENDIDRLFRKARDGDRDLSKLGKTLGALGKGVVLTGIVAGLTSSAAQAGALAIQVAGIVPALTSILSLGAALPGLFVAAKVATGILKAALVGVEDAVKAAFNPEDAAAFAKALEKLSPAAREVAVGLRKIAPELVKFQQGLQEAFFRGMDLMDVMPRLRGIMSQLRAPTQGLAQDFGNIVRRFADFATEQKSVNFVRDAINSLRGAIQNIFPAFTPLLNGLRDVGTVGIPLMEQLGSAVGGVGIKFGEWLSEIAADGRLETWIDTALNTLGELGGIAQNVGSILNSVFSAASATGGGLLGTIEEVTGQFADFLKSAEGSAAIRDLFSGILAAAKALAPVVTTVAKAVAGPLGNALSRIASEIGPVLLETVQALAPAFGPLLDALVDLLVAVAPILPPLAALVALLATGLAGGVSALAKALGPTIQMLAGSFLPVLQQLLPVIQAALIQALPIAAKAGMDLAKALLPLVPAIIQFGSALLTALLPYLPQLLDSFIKLVPPLTQLATLFADQLSSALIAIIPYLPMIIGFFVSMQTTIYTMVAAGVKLLNFLFRLGSALQAIAGGLIGKVLSSFSTLGPRMWALITSAWNGVRARFYQGVAAAVGVALTLAGRVRSAIGSLVSTMVGVARNAWNQLVSAFNTGRSRAEAVARSLGGRIRSAVGNLGSLLRGAGAAVINGLINGIQSGIGRVLGMVRGLAGQVKGAFNSALSIFSPSRVFFESGVNIDRGLINGIKSKIAQVKKVAESLAKTVIAPTANLKQSAAGVADSTLAQAATRALDRADAGAAASFGPYPLILDGKEIAAFVIDTVTGNPTVVSKAASEGDRQASWSGSGRRPSYAQ
jgi:phage-related protein